MQYIRVVLAVELRRDDLYNLVRCLARMGPKILTATSAEQSLQLLRTELFDAAIVAIELKLDDEPMVAHLSRLPAMRCLVAVGPGNNWEMEKCARFAGADAYLPRPVTTEALAAALQMPLVEAGLREARWPPVYQPRPP